MNPVDSYDGERVRICEPGQLERIGYVIWSERSDPPQGSTKFIRIRFPDKDRHGARTRIYHEYVSHIPTPYEIVVATLDAFAKAETP